MLENYFKIALRNLRAQRGYTLLNVLGLTVGIAGGLLLFQFIRHHISTDRHHRHFERIYRIVTDMHLEDGSVEPYPEAPLPMAAELRRTLPQVEQSAFLMARRSMTITLKRPGLPAPLRFLEADGTTALVEPELFQILDYHWLQGNAKTALRSPNSVVLTESVARKYFGDINPMGQQLDIDHRATTTVTGVVADPSQPTDTNIGVFVSLATIRQLDPEYELTSWWQLNSTNRLYLTLKDAKSATARQVEAQLPAMAKTHYAEMANIYQFHLQPIADIHFDVTRIGGVIRPSLLWSLGLIGVFLVLIACINFVNLATAQAVRRSKEVGVRKTLGGSRGQLAGQFLLETSLIVAVSLLLAIGFFALLSPLFTNWIHGQLTIQPDRILGLVVGSLFLGVVLVAGGYPAFMLSGFSPWASLRGKPTTASAGGLSLRKGLVVLQFVLCQSLLIGALVVVKQIRYIQQTDLGFKPDNIVVISLPYETKQSWQGFKSELQGLPGVESVSLQYRPPSATVMNGGSFKFAGGDWVKYPVRERLADADYLSTYGFKLIAGRNMAPSDSIREYVINETLARKLGYRNPADILGKRMQYYLSTAWLPIVGVISDFHQRSLREAIGPCLITSYPAMYRQVGIRLTGQSTAMTLAKIRVVWQRMYPNDVCNYEFLTDQLTQFYETERTISRLANLFTGIAILICALGLFGLVSFTVGQRIKEIGVRKVLGASVLSIVALLSKDFLRLVLIAIVVGSPLACYGMNHWLADFAYRTTISWWIFALAGLLAVGIALVTVSFQSIKAALVNPVDSLRSE